MPSATCTATRAIGGSSPTSSLFVFSMTMLVSVSNFVLLYVFWEAVGVCSYLLVGFWYEKPAAAAAGKKAFLVNRVGDFGFALGLFLIFVTYGTLNFHDTPTGVAGVLGQTRLAVPSLYVGGGARPLAHLPAAAGGSLRQECPVSAARLAARRHGRPHARQRADPRGHDGHGRRLHGDPLHAAVLSVARRAGRRGRDRHVHGPDGRRRSPSRRPT